MKTPTATMTALAWMAEKKSHEGARSDGRLCEMVRDGWAGMAAWARSEAR